MTTCIILANTGWDGGGSVPWSNDDITLVVSVAIIALPKDGDIWTEVIDMEKVNVWANKLLQKLRSVDFGE